MSKRARWLMVSALAWTVFLLGCDPETSGEGPSSSASTGAGGDATSTGSAGGGQGGEGASPSCGNGVTEGGEACDDGGESAACNADCSAASCGDGVLNTSAGETCDDGGESAACNADCSAASCGDGILNTFTGETCDDGGESAACNADCSAASCGDGVLNTSAGETCDDGGESAACNADCSAASCGDGILNISAGETCDESGESAACNIDCSATSCGDGILNISAGETCDDGGESAACNADCSAAACGDGILNTSSGEACDDSGESAACNSNCSAASCGDGLLNVSSGETCDDGGESAACNSNCSAASCGDGIVNTSAGEACDDSGESAACDADCSAALCGDGTLNTSAGEACDDSGESAACDANCTAPFCGDGTQNAAAGEDCDDGDVANGDGCSGECAAECVSPPVLSTGFTGYSGSSGNMFDVIATHEVTLTSFDLNLTAGTHGIEIYIRYGTFVGNETNAAAWTQIASSSIVSSGPDVPSPVVLPVPKTLPAGQLIGVYVTSTGGSIRYSTGTQVPGAVVVSDGILTVTEGAAIGYPFLTVFPDRIWRGAIHYMRSGTTTFAGGAGVPPGQGGGSMFDVTAKNQITIEGVALNLNPGLANVEIHYRPGGYAGSESDPSAWVLAASASNVNSAGSGVPTILPVSPPITLQAGETFGLYVTTVSNGSIDTLGSAEGNTYQQDQNLAIGEGVGLVYPFGAGMGVSSPRVWNGTLLYTVCGAPVTTLDYPVIARGGTLVLTGSGFSGATGVDIGGVAQPFTVDSDYRITVAPVSDLTPLGAQPAAAVPAGGGPSGTFPVTVIDLVVNELDSDQSGTDTLEFVEIATGVANVNLTGYSLVFWDGANDAAYQAFDLGATTDVNGLLVVGSSLLPQTPAIVWSGSNILQNGADAVGLYQSPASAFITGVTGVTTTRLLDGIVYDTSDADDAGLLAGIYGAGYAMLPTALQIDENGNGAGITESIQRCGPGRLDATKLGLFAPPSPGLPNAIMPCP